MRIAVEIALSDDEVAHLSKLSKSRSVSVRLAERSQIILLAGAGMTNEESCERKPRKITLSRHSNAVRFFVWGRYNGIQRPERLRTRLNSKPRKPKLSLRDSSVR